MPQGRKVKKQITDKNGKRTSVWVNPESSTRTSRSLSAKTPDDFSAEHTTQQSIEELEFFQRQRDIDNHNDLVMDLLEDSELGDHFRLDKPEFNAEGFIEFSVRHPFTYKDTSYKRGDIFSPHEADPDTFTVSTTRGLYGA